MKKSTMLKIVAIIGTSVFLVLSFTGCGSNGDGFLAPGMLSPGPGSGPGPGTINLPIAKAGADQYVASAATVTLDGSQSYDPNGTALTYSWKFDLTPAGSSAVLSDATAVNPTFRADRPGLYQVYLVVSNGSLASNPDSVDIIASNDAPIANAGTDQSVNVSDLVMLDGSASSDPNGDSLTYQWTLDKPWNSSAVLSDANAVNPTFTPDASGTYTLYLRVYDGTAYSSFSDTIRVTALTTAVANAGPDQYKTTGSSTVITLDGSGSHDSAGRPMTYAWSFTRKPAGSTATLSDPASVTPTFMADLEGKYELSLQIFYNGCANSWPDTVTVVVITDKPVAGLPFKVIDAEYSKQLDRIIMVSGTPSNQIHIYDPITNTDQTVDLSAVPTSVSVSPDGLHAAIGHDSIITYADLVSKSVVTTLQAGGGDILDIVLAGNGYIYALRNPFIAVNISTGAVTAWTNGAGIKARLHPSGMALYTTIGYAALKFDISSGPLVYLYSSNNIPGRYYNVGDDIWMTEDGTSLITQSGNIFNASSGSTNDMMTPKTYFSLQSQYVSDSLVAARLALIPMTQVYANMSIDDTELWTFDHYFGLIRSDALPRFVTGGRNYPGHGKFVFFDSTGAKMFIVMQADAASGLQNDFAVTTY
jgi:hypothetical protein